MRVLVIEDEYKIANAIKKGLTAEGYAVDVAYNGDDGLASALNDPCDIVILDRMLPGGFDGIKIITELRKSGNRVPVLFLTAKDAVSDRVSGLDAGADDYLVKPFAFEELVARIRVLTRAGHKHAEPELRYKTLSLNLLTKKAQRSGDDIELSLKEFALLDYMMRNPEVVLSKQQLIEHVWNYDADILPNTVEAFIGLLRSKIDKPYRPITYIQTVRGFGYKLEEKP